MAGFIGIIYVLCEAAGKSTRAVFFISRLQIIHDSHIN